MVALARSVHAPLPSRRLGPALAGVGVLAFVVALALFVDLGRPAFWDPGESRYAETVREMLLTRDWLAPTLATARYYDKPAPYFWLIAASFGAFGRSESSNVSRENSVSCLARTRSPLPVTRMRIVGAFVL